MEEDIKVLEDYAYAMCTISCTTEKDKRIAQAIENLIAKNKELEEGNKKWKEVYDEDQEHILKLNNKIFSLEEENARLKAPPFFDEDDYIPKSKVKEIIEKLDKRVLEPEKTNWFAGLTIGEALMIKGFLKRELLQEGDK